MDLQHVLVCRPGFGGILVCREALTLGVALACGAGLVPGKCWSPVQHRSVTLQQHRSPELHPHLTQHQSMSKRWSQVPPVEASLPVHHLFPISPQHTISPQHPTFFPPSRLQRAGEEDGGER